MSEVIRNLLKFQMVRYGIVGTIGAVIDFGLLNLLVLYLDWNVYLAATVGFTAAASSNYVLNLNWTFRDSPSKHRLVQYGQFILVALLGLMINNGTMYILIENFGWWFNFAKLSAVLVVFVWNYLANRYWTFR